MEEKAKQIASLLKVLANENRLLILCSLINEALTVNEIKDKVDSITQSAVSQHLAILKAHGIVECNKKAQSITYFISDSKVVGLMDYIKCNYCK